MYNHHSERKTDEAAYSVGGALWRESAVVCIGEVSGGWVRALPTGFCGGKARSDGMQRPPEGVCALCLQDSAEGKRGRMPWKCIWRGQACFASKGADEKDIVHVHKKSDHPPGTGSALGGRD